LLKRLGLTLLLPVGLALLADLLMGTLPWITLAVSLLAIPLASLVVGKAVLRDFERVLAVVAPEPVAATDEHNDAALAEEGPPVPEEARMA
jgi:hypothetical protein